MKGGDLVNRTKLSKVESELSGVESIIREWREKVVLTESEASDIFDHALLLILENKTSLLRAKLDIIKVADNDDWNNVEAGLSENLADIKTTFEEAKKNMQKRIPHPRRSGF